MLTFLGIVIRHLTESENNLHTSSFCFCTRDNTYWSSSSIFDSVESSSRLDKDRALFSGKKSYRSILSWKILSCYHWSRQNRTNSFNRLVLFFNLNFGHWRSYKNEECNKARFDGIYLIQENLPAWMQEPYRPPRSKCSPCCSVSWWKVGGGWWRGGQGGTPSSPNGEGTPSSLDGEVLHPVLTGGTLGYHLLTTIGQMGVPHQPDGGTPHQEGWGVTHPIKLDGVPPVSQMEVHPPPQVWTDWEYYLPSSFECGR